MRQIGFIVFIFFVLFGITKTLEAQTDWRYFRKFDPFSFEFKEEVIQDSLSEPCIKVRYQAGKPVRYKNLVDNGHYVSWARPKTFSYANGFVMEVDTIQAHGPDNFLLFKILGRDTLVSLEYISPKKFRKPKWRLFSAFLEYEGGNKTTFLLYRKNVKWDLPIDNTKAINLSLAPIPYSVEMDQFRKINNHEIRAVSHITFNKNGGIDDIIQKIQCLNESNPSEKKWEDCDRNP